MNCLTSSVVVLGALLAGVAQGAEPVEVFTNKGEVFMRAGEGAGLAVGVTVGIVGEPTGKKHQRRRLGSATVMQVWPAMARLTLDDAARADKSKKKFAVVESKPVAEAAAPAPPPPPAPRPAPAAPAKAKTGLVGHATFTGVGPFKALKLFNDDERRWTNCSLKLPGSLYYALDQLDAGDHKTIVRSSFEVRGGVGRDVPIDQVEATCDEGEATFVFPN